MNILVINLPERTDRLEQIKKELPKLFDKFDFTIIPGIKGEPIPSIVQAHKNAIQYAKDNNWEQVLVLEDDLCLSSNPRLRYYFEESISNTPRGAEVLSGSCYGKTITTVFKKWCKVKTFCGAHFLIYNKYSYDKILNHDFKRQHYDRELNKIVNLWVMNPMIAKEHGGFSNQLNQEVNHSHYPGFRML